MKLPAWVKSIPESSAHGSGTYQKRLWRLVSDTVRIRDFYSFKGRCVATEAILGDWRGGNAGHWKSYSCCNGMYKFDPENIHLQSASSNSWGGMEIGHAMGEEIKRRHGKNALKNIEKHNRETELKITDSMVIEKIRDILEKMKDLPEQPKYYPRVMELLASYETKI